LAYLEWAERWLLRLQKANQQVHSYPEPAFSELLGRFWLKVCWYASANLGWTVWRRFWQSSLHKGPWLGMRKLFFLDTAKFFPSQACWGKKSDRLLRKRHIAG